MATNDHRHQTQKNYAKKWVLYKLKFKILLLIIFYSKTNSNNLESEKIK